MLKRVFCALLVAGASLLGLACLEKQTTQTLYLSPEGAVTWTVQESDVRSTEHSPADREREEAEYRSQAEAGAHPILQALERLHPAGVESRLLRGERPMAFWGEARFDGVDGLARELLAALHVPGTVDFVWDGEGRHLRMSGKIPRDFDSELIREMEPLLTGMPDSVRLVLTSGRFTSGKGVKLSEDGREARLDPDTLLAPSGEWLLELNWKEASPAE